MQVLAIVLLLATSVSIGFALVARQEARQALNDKDTTSALALALAANRIEEPPRESQRVLLEAAFSPGPRRSFDA